MRNSVRIGWLMLVMVVLPWAPASAQTIVFGANESPPFWSSEMDQGGMGGAIVQAISREAGLHAAIEFKPLQRLIDLDTGNDVGNPVFFMRNQDYAAIIPIAIYQSALFYYAPNHANSITFQRLDDLKKYRIGILKGTLLDRTFFARAGIDFAESYSQESLFKKLKLGRIDLVLEIDMIGYHTIGKLFPEERDAFQSLVMPQSSNPIAMMMAEETPAAIAEKYQAALKRIIRDGRYLGLLETYYGKDRVPDNWFDQLERFQRLYSFGGES